MFQVERQGHTLLIVLAAALVVGLRSYGLVPVFSGGLRFGWVF